MLSRNFGDAEIRVVELIEDQNLGFENITSQVKEEHSAQIASPILNLGADSDLFLGGIPSGKKIPSAMVASTFDGCMEELKYDSQRMGLWNWKVYFKTTFGLFILFRYLYNSVLWEFFWTDKNDSFLNWHFEKSS